jgi:glycolate oxidase FAD binding subunit
MVMKNVAGYDLIRLQYGALGSLGVITAANFKLQPVPESSAAAIGTFATPIAAEAVIRRLLSSRLQPAAVLMFSAVGSAMCKHWQFCVRFDGRERAVIRQTSEVMEWARAAGGDQVAALDAQAVQELWPGLVDFSQMAEVEDDEVLLRVNMRTSDSLAALSTYCTQCEALKLSASSLADLACGVIWLRIQASVEHLAGMLPGLLQEWRAGRTQVIVAAASPVLRAQLDLWGPAPSALPVMQRLKRRFDPNGVLNVGRDLVSASLMAGGRDENGEVLPVECEASHVD